MNNALYILPLLAFTLLAFLSACQPTEKAKTTVSESQTPSVSAPAITATSTSVATADPLHPAFSTTAPTLTTDGKIQIDWTKIDTGEPVVDKQKFAYKFAPDSLPVQNYAKAYKVDNLTAQYNLTIGMGANEPLDKILDQIGTSYVSHELTAGKDSKLIIHTTPKVVASEHDFVLTDPFAKGLVLPVKIVPDGKKS